MKKIILILLIFLSSFVIARSEATKQSPEDTITNSTEPSNDSVLTSQDFENSKFILNNSKFILVLDPAHGYDVSGKRAPDESFFEWSWSREIFNLLTPLLDSMHINYGYSNTNDFEIGLRQRVYNTNLLTRKYKHSLLLSLHANAASWGITWEKARGHSIWTSRGYNTSDKYADIFYNQFCDEFANEIDTGGIKLRGLWEANFAVLMCRGPAILIETLFEDNFDDVQIMNSQAFKNRFTNVLFKSITKIISDL